MPQRDCAQRNGHPYLAGSSFGSLHIMRAHHTTRQTIHRHDAESTRMSAICSPLGSGCDGLAGQFDSRVVRIQVAQHVRVLRRRSRLALRRLGNTAKQQAERFDRDGGTKQNCMCSPR